LACLSTGVPQPGQDSDKETGSMLFCTTVNLSSAAESSPETLFDPKAVINLGVAVVAAPYDSVGVVGCCDCSCIVSCMSLLLACLHVVLAGCHRVIVAGCHWVAVSGCVVAVDIVMIGIVVRCVIDC